MTCIRNRRGIKYSPMPAILFRILWCTVYNGFHSESLCCAGIPSNMWFLTKRTETMSGIHVPVYRDTKGQVMFGNTKVTTCDLTTSNDGVIHIVDSVSYTSMLQMYSVSYT
jgi:hypothetical protein